MNTTTPYDQIGKYGTLMFMKQREQNTVVAAFGIDRDELTFGRENTCDIRLLYPNALPVHCKIRFDESHKAFLVVLASGGVVLEGEPISSFSSSSNVTVPLANNSDIEVLGKKFRFSYPPREMRPVLHNSPAPNSRQKPRLSLIQSAQVFTPRPSPDPRENLRILQSPLKPFKSPVKSKLASEVTDEEAVLLVEGNNPKVVEEDKDLVILEHVAREESSPTKKVQLHGFPPQNSGPQTPKRRSNPSLHRHVLLKSAHKLVIRNEQEREEEAEMDEVFGAITSQGSESDSDSSEEPVDENVNGEEETEENPSTRTSWRQSLERIWPFRGASAEAEPQQGNLSAEMEDDINPSDDDIHLAEDEALSTESPEAPTEMTGIAEDDVSQNETMHSRLSLGAGLQPRRIFATPHNNWKVQDIVVPGGTLTADPQSPISPERKGRPRDSISQEQRKAIAERRRSALMTPDTFFGPKGIPGMSPKRPSVSPSKSVLPQLPEIDNNGELPDSRDILVRLKETMEGVKRRQSLQPSSPQKSIFLDNPMDVDLFAMAKGAGPVLPSVSDDEIQMFFSPTTKNIRDEEVSKESTTIGLTNILQSERPQSSLRAQDSAGSQHPPLPENEVANTPQVAPKRAKGRPKVAKAPEVVHEPADEDELQELPDVTTAPKRGRAKKVPIISEPAPVRAKRTARKDEVPSRKEQDTKEDLPTRTRKAKTTQVEEKLEAIEAVPTRKSKRQPHSTAKATKTEIPEKENEEGKAEVRAKVSKPKKGKAKVKEEPQQEPEMVGRVTRSRTART